MCVGRVEEEVYKGLMMCVILNPFFVLAFQCHLTWGIVNDTCVGKVVERKACTNGYMHNVRTHVQFIFYLQQLSKN